METRSVSTELIMRDRDSGVEHRLPVTHTATPGLGTDDDQGRFSYELAGFEAAVDIATAADGRPLGDGLWDISLAIGAQGLSKEVRIGSRRTDDVSGKASTRVVAEGPALRAVTLYTTKPHGNFTLDLGEVKHEVQPHLGLDITARWAADAPTELEVAGRCALADHPDGELKVVLTDDEGTAVAFPARQVAGDAGSFAVRVPVTELAAGTWRGELRLGHWHLPLPELPTSLPPAKWRRRALPWYAEPAPRSDRHFALRVARRRLMEAAAGRVK
ncbi:hypothetical protein NX794_02280 [Streptomyces sp. LP11]|uniref:Uncharacterized protein n=1 Tax=Streptomyces pyxinicus TaxID=2970331 RepID=A0ABT2AUZ5_9ACTN|nr:hypothetical protein [Streptomyces sp. LP11]MCS0600069.1 hypothetical protein [Streptomyces sp. LP11]